MRIEVRAALNELADYWIHFAQVVLGAPKARSLVVGVWLRSAVR
jgi:hypothetical protein